MLLLTGLLVGLVVGFSRRVTLLAAAQLADQRLGLKERLSSALLLSDGVARDPMAAAQLGDAVEHSREVCTSAVFPWRLPREARACAATLALLLGLLYLPDLPFLQSPRARADRLAMSESGAQLQAAAHALERRNTGDRSRDEILRQVARNLKRLGRDQARGRVTKKEALLRANQLRKRLEDAEQRMGPRPPSQSLERAAQSLRKAAERQAGQGDQESARSLQRMSEAAEKGDLEAASRALVEIGRQLERRAAAGQLSAEDLERAAELLRDMAGALAETRADAAAAELQRAAERLSEAVAQAESLAAQLGKAESAAERARLEQELSELLSRSLAQAGGT